MVDTSHMDGLSRSDVDDNGGIGGGVGMAPVAGASVPLSSKLVRHATSLDVDSIGRSKLFDLGQIDVRWEPEMSTLWAFMTPTDRPNYNLQLLGDIKTWQAETRRVFGGPGSPLKFMVLGSRFPGAFNLGGDLQMFAGCIDRQEREGLRHYAYLCIDVVERAWASLDMPIINIGLAQGDALGGGFEALLCHDVIIAERQARFGLPEILFGLFPGMGAFSILARKIGHVAAERMILSGKVYTAEEMYEMGLVTLLADEGAGEEVAKSYIRDNLHHHAGISSVYHSGRRVNPLHISELRDIVDSWVDAAMQLTAKDLKLMRRLAAAQSRLHQK